MKRPTPKTVNKALAAAGLPYIITRNLLGGSYYYFSSTSTETFYEIPSLYQYTLDGITEQDIVDHVREYHEKEASRAKTARVRFIVSNGKGGVTLLKPRVIKL